MTRRQKERELKVLAKKRQRDRRRNFKGIDAFWGGRYECDYVSPYTKTAGNVNSKIMVILQDWSSADALRQQDEDSVRLGFSPRVATNRNLSGLLAKHFDKSLSDIYATNVFPFIKTGNMSSEIPFSDLEWAAVKYARPQIEIVSPKLVICLGLKTFNAVRKAFGEEAISRINDAIRSPFRWKRTQIWCQAHTGARGTNNRGFKQVQRDWNRMKTRVSLTRN